MVRRSRRVASPQEYEGLADGTHSFEVRAVDEAGNVDASPASFAWRVDTVAPETSITSGPAAVTSSASASFVFQADEAASFECSLDEGPFGDCSAPQGLVDGEHSFAVRAVDEAGNVDASPAIHRWRVDTVAPETAIDAAPADPSASATALLAFAADESGSFECSLDGAAFAACVSPQQLVGLADGEHSFEVRAVDEAGNVDASPASIGWRVDTVAPETCDRLGRRMPSRRAARASSRSRRTRPARSSARSTGRLRGVRVRRRSTPGWPRVRTCSRCVRWTRRGTWMRRRRASLGGWTRSRRRRRSTRAPAAVTSSTSASVRVRRGRGRRRSSARSTGRPSGHAARRRSTSAWRMAAHVFEVRAVDRGGERGWVAGELRLAGGHGRAGDDRSTRARRRSPRARARRFAFAADEAASFECSLDGAAFGECELAAGVRRPGGR